MKTKAYNKTFLVLALIIMSQDIGTRAESVPNTEYQVKAVFLYNFISFVEWPGKKEVDANEPITIGIIGKDPFGDAFEPIKDKQVRGRQVVIKRFKSLAELRNSDGKADSEADSMIEDLRKVHVLFISSSEDKNLNEILNLVKDYRVLTVGETKGFLEAGGTIRFLIEENKIRFEVNLVAAKQAKIKMRSQLLRLAKRVLEEKDVPVNEQ